MLYFLTFHKHTYKHKNKKLRSVLAFAYQACIVCVLTTICLWLFLCCGHPHFRSAYVVAKTKLNTWKVGQDWYPKLSGRGRTLGLYSDLTVPLNYLFRHRGFVKHIEVKRGAEGYFGFAVNYTTYPTLVDLVRHYHENTLQIHNPELDTTLKFPVGSAVGRVS